VQALQLVYGGRDPKLREARTLDMLAALEEAGHLPRGARERLALAYTFLRQIEHRLQMRLDEQTQILPREGDDLEAFARWCGFTGAKAFEKAFAAHTAAVRAEATKAFGERAAEARGPDAAFTAKELGALGFRRPAEAAALIGGWTAEPERSSARAMETRRALAAILPDLVAALGQTDDPDAAITAFDRAFARMAAPAELFSILAESEPLRRLFASMLGSAPRLAEAIVQRPHLLDVLIDVRALAEEQTAPRVGERMAARISSAASREEALDLLRDAGREEWFLAGARFLGEGDAARLGAAYTVVADASLRVALGLTDKAFAAEHGRVAGAALAVVAMGRLGSREMTATSDLDLIVIYEAAAAAAASDGPRPLDRALYFSRLTHRLITAVSAPTAHGSLYEIDMRLRPSGGKGPVALPLEAFVDYQMREAETWEHLALTRARPVAGDPRLCRKVAGAIKDILARPRDRARLARDVKAMRALLAQEKGDEDAADVKNMRGGLTDIDFCAQFLVLAHGASQPSLLSLAPAAALAQAATLGLVASEDADKLIEARALFSELLQRERLRSTEAARLNWNDAAILRDVARHLGFASSAALARAVAKLRKEVAAIHDRLIVG
jgi:glutamate-ammonia-ligase adenylyltransferase